MGFDNLLSPYDSIQYVENNIFFLEPIFPFKSHINFISDIKVELNV